MTELIVILSYMFAGILVWEFLKIVFVKLKPSDKQGKSAAGTAISQHAQNELERIYEATGYTAHKVSSALLFNGYIKSEGSPEAQNIERLLLKYSSNGFVFTKGESLIGKVSTIPTNDARAKMRRSRFKVISGLKN